MDCSPPGSSVHGILQARIPEWAAISSFRGSSPPGIELMSHVSCFGKGGSLSLAPPGKPQVAPFSTEKVQVFFVQGVGRKKITHYEV